MLKTRVRLIDVAERAKVSRAAVARVLIGTGAGRIRVSDEKAALIKRLAQEMGFQPDNPAQMLAGKKSKIIGILIDSYAPQVRFKILSVAEEILARKGFRIMIGQTHDNYDNFKSYITDFASRRVDGIICFAHEYPDFDISGDFDSFRNVVFVGKPRLEQTNFVEYDIKAGVEKLVDHLVASGRRKIGYFMLNSGSLANKQRMAGYLQALAKHDIAFEEKLIFNGPHFPDKDDYMAAVDYLVKQQQVDAVIANNDIWAANFIKYSKKCGIKVPRDVAVTGFDNIDIAEISDPELTTIDPECALQGRALAEMMIDMILKKTSDTPRQVVIEPRLIVRESA